MPSYRRRLARTALRLQSRSPARGFARHSGREHRRATRQHDLLPNVEAQPTAAASHNTLRRI
ncbi:hypothetical protein XCV2990 [Xanthomonas euvesicatoria pv. vesicatoria str. 85-10]|uniref:Uncharacterized protein n=1 Tax=Xanthomonas euvesicatoria pv. vesicatoria (strain 85-10) TaxID=316273 RepID=Q3BR92_XANE5|nr:hypothetical protein XCV2990 [Xanthomonas euvesicatoria pv. vesicatoria str. 85-10]